MVRIFLALAALVGLMWLASWLGKASPEQRVRAIKLILLYGVAGALLVLVVTGRIPWMFALISAAVPWLQRFMVARQAWSMFKSSQGPTAGKTSNVETAFLRMILDHDSGDLDGEVISGPFAGRQLSQLSHAELQSLLAVCREQDAQSASLLEAYLDRTQGPLSTDQALQILGLEKNASLDEIQDAHRRLIQKLHTDRGGTDYLAALINEARDTLTAAR